MIRGYYGVHLGIEVAGTEKVEIRTLKVGRYCAVDDSAFKILKISKSKPGKHGSAKARLDLEDLFTGSKKSHVGTVTDKISIPIIEKGSATVTHIQGVDVHAMDAKTFEMMVLPLEDGLNLESGREIQWMEALGRFRIIRDH
ncbi:MAG TPA: translation initiation factor IF-5A [Candidatus Poseidoniales archaeon]|jgi:translation initiation factor 5A|nr:MAG: translation initiation factor IF-5A [Euryarchaeota archaeon]HIA24907.1 translation initiation factor IF-5A [Candidatus Poseidoniales archaeon]PXY79873.1 MAG: translation initiation factor IF-5A [Euryarchaeota archaeon]HIB41373.1 translation initiation factor IF-5A [Candidatus Poseidoniales archaeon]HIN44576.1 translation initiation factor IF-5A [Candidatus Poseidoniales archaeon]